MKKHIQFIACSLLISLLSTFNLIAQSIVGKWFNEEKTAKIQIYEAKDDHYYGKIIWLKEPEENGNPRLDKNNPDKKKRTEPLLGLLILKRLKDKGNGKYEGGTVYDPKNGKTYSGTITIKSNVLELLGYVGFSAFGRTSIWTKAE